MRRFRPRPDLPHATQQSLERKTVDILRNGDHFARAIIVYTNSRSAKWFAPITATLRLLAGAGERCMFCSGSECSQVEHFRPKETFPELAMTWANFLWVCGYCNNLKGAKFPVLADGATIINPLEEDVWEFFFLDQFGNLSERWRPNLNALDPRALITTVTLGLDREALQSTRRSRFQNLCELAQSSIQLLQAGLKSREQILASIEDWKGQPLQSDVADYFLEGPGRNEEPFRQLLEMTT